MKKISLILVVIAVFALVLVEACGGNNGEEETTTATTSATTTTSTAPATTTTAAQTTQPSNGGGGGLTWNDMPIYGGADQIQEFNMSFTPEEDEDYSKMEWRYYETGDDVDDVVDFYKDKMPDNGWDEQMWADMGEIAYGMYFKNNEKDAAMVWIASEEGNTAIALWRASE
jgi:hypothetical protein